MLTVIKDSVLALLPSRRRTSSSGWISFNAPCCQHRGHKPDTRSRGGVIAAADGSISYHCFNCQFKTSYRPGWHLGYGFRRFLSWLGADESLIHRLAIDAVRVKDIVGPAVELPKAEVIEFRARPLPDDVRLIDQDQIALRYCYDRKINLDRYPLLVSSSTKHNLNRRVIIPFTWNNQLIGYTARAWDENVRPKYHSQYESDYVFNMDQQRTDGEFVLVSEGPFDAMSVDGVAILSNHCSEKQADIIDRLNREVILVPDRDQAGQQLITQALEYGWSVSFPVWHETCKDVNEAVIRYGKLFVLKTILDGKETSRLKIQLRRKKL